VISTARRWLSIDGLVTMLLALNWGWFIYVLALMYPMLLPEEPQPAPSGALPTEGTASPSGLQRFQIARLEQQTDHQNDSPILFVLVLILMTAAALVTLADHARRQGRIPPVLIGLGGCAAAGLGFVAIQISRFSEPAFSSVHSLDIVLLWERAEALSLNLLAGLSLLILSAIVMLVRATGETPALVEQVTAWHWHALDTFWLILVALAWHRGVMEGL
jgi:heme/copper-type cytochrome/quinol oxidase subunit 3